MTIYLRVTKIAAYAKTLSDPIAFLARNFTIVDPTIQELSIPLAAYILVAKKSPELGKDIPMRVDMYEALELARDHVKNIAAGLVLKAPQPVVGKMCTEYPDNPMSDRTRSQWQEWRKKHGGHYVGIRRLSEVRHTKARFSVDGYPTGY